MFYLLILVASLYVSAKKRLVKDIVKYKSGTPLHHNITVASTLANKVLALENGNIQIYGAFSKTEVTHKVAELYGYVS